jgi:ABC-type sugar transport system ATPase subunit
VVSHTLPFQNYALYPHMTIFNNMAFGLQLAKKKKDFISEIVGRTSKALGLDKMLDRKPQALSGGQRQRVALGRAIVRTPRSSCSMSPYPTWTPRCASKCARRFRGCTPNWAPP